MPDLSATGVTIVRAWHEGGPGLKDRVAVIANIVLSAMGGNVNRIPAAAFGLRVLEGCTNAVRADGGAVVVAGVTADGSRVVLADLTQATDASRATPADVSGTFRITVYGY